MMHLEWRAFGLVLLLPILVLVTACRSGQPGGPAPVDGKRDEPGPSGPPWFEDATAAFWSTVHGVTSLLISGFWSHEAPAIRLVRDAIVAQLTRPALPRRRVKSKKGKRDGSS